jgi:probable rRNA maturation factor
MIEIDVQNDAGYAVDADRLRAAATLTAQQSGREAASLTIVITDDKSVAALNRQFRGVDAPTDVLSFPADAPPPIPDDDGVMEDNELPYLGDLVIAYPYASAQAGRLGHNLMDSLTLLVVHGTLHLLGADHDTEERRAAMWAAQARALTSLGVPLTIVPALEEGEHGGPEDEVH